MIQTSDPLKIRLICLHEGEDEICPYGVEDIGLECWEERCELLWVEEWDEDNL